MLSLWLAGGRPRRAIGLFGAERLLLHPDCGFATFADNPICSAAVAQAKRGASEAEDGKSTAPTGDCSPCPTVDPAFGTERSRTGTSPTMRSAAPTPATVLLEKPLVSHRHVRSQ
jgi:hypothetical protein